MLRHYDSGGLMTPVPTEADKIRDRTRALTTEVLTRRGYPAGHGHANRADRGPRTPDIAGVSGRLITV